MVVMSAETMTKLDSWLPSEAVERQCSLEGDSFEKSVGTGRSFGETQALDGVPWASLGTMHDG